ncbi:probable L-type lectin-domain containing receptor kinase S.5 isoform X2 [Quercus robur]|uniref:probable L-type lectin-domain containing receptor kinase S.5 isoform X2 n=1 Tax=Quercus robur TaxID=38942 RepID=UPI0021633180|nr:probable L-type lectin-domain containing receptor kinase S.5 isoform X2 [Quercus robur]
MLIRNCLWFMLCPLTTTMLSLLFFSTFLIQASLSSVMDPVTFSFPTFNTESCSNRELICMGSATAVDGYLSITPEPQHGNFTQLKTKVGRVLYSHPMLAWPANISTIFTVRISPFQNSTDSGDGMAFIIAPNHDPSPPDSHGFFLGILDRSTEGIVRQLAVELDTFKNEYDLDGNHIGIDTTSMINPIAAKSLNDTGIELKSGRDIKVKIDYDGWKKMLQISVGYSRKPLVTVLEQSIVMSDTVPRSVFVGFTGSTGLVSESHRVIDWVFTSVPLPSSSIHNGHEKDNKIKKIVLVSVTTCFMVLLVIVTCVFLPSVLRKLRKKNQRDLDIETQSRNAANVPKMFTYKQLSKATRNFSKENLLGKGGFGSVYRGTISVPPKVIAVKKISATSKQGEREYMAEISTIGRMRHKNIVQLQGWCHEGENLLLVYEFMSNGSLDRFIGKEFLDWETRYKILTGLASALLYLHEECGDPVVHRDIKPNNVMLDSDFNAHLGDFGLARILQNDASVTTMLAGTPGYLAPEMGFIGKATPESDVYSFGMVVLEVVCGKRSKDIMDEHGLVHYVWNLYGENGLLECVDQMLQGKFDEEQVKRTLIVGLSCLHPDSMFRPKMRKVVNILMDPNEPVMNLPGNRPSGVYVVFPSNSSTSPTDTDGSLLLQSSMASLMSSNEPIMNSPRSRPSGAYVFFSSNSSTSTTATDGSSLLQSSMASLMNPNKPLMNLPGNQPREHLSFSSTSSTSTTTTDINFGSKSGSALLQSSMPSLDEIEVQSD